MTQTQQATLDKIIEERDGIGISGSRGTGGRILVGSLLESLTATERGVVDDAIIAIGDKFNLRTDYVFRELSTYWFLLNGRPTNRFGVCKFLAREIEVHEELVGHPEEFVDTLFHEIAHAVTHAFWPDDNDHHGRKWKLVATQLLARPDRCKDGYSNVINRQPKWTYTCDTCGYKYNVSRKLKRVERRYHGLCRKTGAGLGKLNETQNY